MNDDQIRQNALDAWMEWSESANIYQRIPDDTIPAIKTAFMSGYVIAKKEF